MPKLKPETWTRRFWARVDKTGECWNWIGSTSAEGYGQICLDYKTCSAHRVSYAMHFGQVPVGMSVLHRCDNRRCIRPDHLFLGTHQDNMRDAASKHRMVGRPGVRGLCRNGHQRTPDNILRRINRRTPSGFEYVCRICFDTYAERTALKKETAACEDAAAPRDRSIRRDCAASASNHMRTAGK